MSGKISSDRPTAADTPTTTELTSTSTQGADDARRVGEAIDDFVKDTMADAWESGEALSEGFQDFVRGNSKDGSVASAVVEGGKTVLEMMAESSASAASAKEAALPAASAAGGDGVVGEIQSALTSSPADLSEMNQTEFRAMMYKDIFAKMDHEDRLQFAAKMGPTQKAGVAENISRALMARGDIPDSEIAEVRDKILDATEDVVLHSYEALFTEYTTSVILDAQSSISDRFNADSSARREVLASFAEKSAEPQAIAKMMVATLAIPKSAAEDIAQKLAELHDQPDQIAALRSGEEGPETLSGLGDGEYLDLEQDLESALEEAASNMGGLVTQLKNDNVKGLHNDDHRALVNPNFKVAHDMFMTRLADDSHGLALDKSALDGLKAMANEERVEAEDNLFWEGLGEKAVVITAGIGLSLMTAGAAAPAVIASASTAGTASGVAAALPDVIQSWEGANLAEQAHAQGQTDAQTVEDAKDARNMAIATTIAGVVAPGLKFNKPQHRELYEHVLLAGGNAVVGEAYGQVVSAGYEAVAALFE